MKKKKLDPNSVPTQPELENSRKNSKKIQKNKKVTSGIISIKNGLREAKKEIKKNLVLNSVHSKPGQENSKKKLQKNSKN